MLYYYLKVVIEKNHQKNRWLTRNGGSGNMYLGRDDLICPFGTVVARNLGKIEVVGSIPTRGSHTFGAKMSDLKYWNLVEEALSPVVDYVSTTDPVETTGGVGMHMFKPYQSERVLALGGLRMRLDWELTAESMNVPNDEKFQYSPERMTDHIGRLIITQLVGDLADIVENGDVESNDPGLKSFDGAVKRGQEPVKIVIDDFCYFRYYAKKKESHEYCAFATIYVEWPVTN